MNILFIGPYRQSDGWGDASLSTIKALITTGHNITLRPIYMGRNIRTTLPSEIEALEYNLQPSYDICIQNVLPHLVEYDGLFRKNIIKFHLETSSIKHTSWPRRLMQMDEMWVNSNIEKNTIINAGLNEDKIKVIPQSFDEQIFTSNYPPFTDPALQNRFIFYFIGQWSTRKGIIELITAYFSEFTINENVLLFIKTGSIEQEQIREHIEGIKQSLGMYKNGKYYPNIIISNNFIPDEEIYMIHHNSNCFVMPSYGESFCIPAVTAMLFGNTPIVTENTGMDQYIPKNCGWYLPSQSTPCATLDRPLLDLYTGHERWRKPNVQDICKAMREAYTNHKNSYVEKKEAGIKQRQYFTHQAVGEKIGSIL